MVRSLSSLLVREWGKYCWQVHSSEWQQSAFSRTAQHSSRREENLDNVLRLRSASLSVQWICFQHYHDLNVILGHFHFTLFFLIFSPNVRASCGLALPYIWHLLIFVNHEIANTVSVKVFLGRSTDCSFSNVSSIENTNMKGNRHIPHHYQILYVI